MKNTKKKKITKKSKKFNLKSPRTLLVIGFLIVSFVFVAVSSISASQMNSLYRLETSSLDTQAQLDDYALRGGTKQNNSDSTTNQNKPTEEKPPAEEAPPAPAPEVKKQALVEKKASVQPTEHAVTPPPPAPAASATTLETASSLSYINSLRAGVGKTALTQNAVMNSWALAHANALANACTLYHQVLGNFLSQNIGPITISSIAENVGYAQTTPAVLEALKNSPGHYANMTGDYNYVGLGVVVATGACVGYVYTTQMFAK